MALKFFANSDGTVDILAKQGESWAFTITVQDSDGHPIDLTGYTAKSQIRSTYTSAEVVAEFECNITDPPNGVVNLSLSPDVTSSIDAFPRSADGLDVSQLREGMQGVYVYDVKLRSGQTTIRALEGKIVVDPEVTR